MKGQKQSRIDLLEKTVNAQNRIIEHLLNESNNMRDLAVGTLETLKLIPGYEAAIEQLKTELTEETSKAEEAKSLETFSN
jgi:predicted RNase H-like nuclease (RuvC/YqgF family)|tara:strand:- start:131 stop:370 length:240 start_codon:yes stop_codon:yes gene_type:complete